MHLKSSLMIQLPEKSFHRKRPSQALVLSCSLIFTHCRGEKKKKSISFALLEYGFTKQHSYHFLCKQAAVGADISNSKIAMHKLRSDDKEQVGKKNHNDHSVSKFHYHLLMLMSQSFCSTRSRKQKEKKKKTRKGNS